MGLTFKSWTHKNSLEVDSIIHVTMSLFPAVILLGSEIKAAEPAQKKKVRKCGKTSRPRMFT
jgi:hypothetical protein